MEAADTIHPTSAPATRAPVVVEYAPLRHAVLLALLDLGGTATVSEMARRLEAQGITSRRYLTRAVSDALRAEVRHGRVARVGHGRYTAVRRSITRRHVRYARTRVREVLTAAGR